MEYKDISLVSNGLRYFLSALVFGFVFFFFPLQIISILMAPSCGKCRAVACSSATAFLYVYFAWSSHQYVVETNEKTVHAYPLLLRYSVNYLKI